MIGSTLQYEIGVTLIKGIGPVLAKNLIAYLGSAEAVFKETQANLAKIPEIGPVLSRQIVDQQVLKRAEKEIAFIQKNNIQTYFYTDKGYPYRLKECTDAPVILYSKGNADLNVLRLVGVVGTRKVTEYGKDLCNSFINDLAALSPGTTIVSGLAYGVDICAHKAAINASLPTIGVGHGLDRIYPLSHRPTAVKMLEQGGLLTEYLTETNPDRPNFVQRNRIVAGMCDALLVVESGEKGGSLITANMAQSYNRDVFAFPGRVGDEHSIGCNALIKTNKAGLIESASDFINAMGWESVAHKKQAVQPSLFFTDLSEEEQQVVDCLREEAGLQLNQLAINMGIAVSKASAMLLEMEFKGIVKCLPGSLYKLRV